MVALRKMDILSLLIVLFAFIGNATLANIDLGLFTLLPLVILALAYKDTVLIPVKRIIPLVLLLAYMSFLMVRSVYIDIPYVDYYFLWPIKAALIMSVLMVNYQFSWPYNNIILIALFVVLLIMVGDMQDGRLYSLFGPNMLYRIFGILYISSIIYCQHAKGYRRSVSIFIAGLSLYALFLTGSSGAFVIILLGAIILAIYTLQSRPINITDWGLLIIFCVTLFATLSYDVIVNSEMVSRVIYKYNTVEESSRVLGWSDLLSRPLTFYGYSHPELNEHWEHGYMYPHNIFVEIYSFYGIIGFPLVGIVIVAAIKSIFRIPKWDIVNVSFVVLLIGSLLSGDLSDNYAVIGLACALIIRSSYTYLGSTKH